MEFDRVAVMVVVGDELGEDFEGVGAVAAAADVEGCCAEFGVFLGEVGDSGQVSVGECAGDELFVCVCMCVCVCW